MAGGRRSQRILRACGRGMRSAPIPSPLPNLHGRAGAMPLDRKGGRAENRARPTSVDRARQACMRARIARSPKYRLEATKLEPLLPVWGQAQYKYNIKHNLIYSSSNINNSSSDSSSSFCSNGMNQPLSRLRQL